MKLKSLLSTLSLIESMFLFVDKDLEVVPLMHGKSWVWSSGQIRMSKPVRVQVRVTSSGSGVVTGGKSSELEGSRLV